MTSAETAGGPNGSGAAAVLAAAIGWFVLGVLALAGDTVPSVKRALTLWKPTGGLSGVTTVAIVAWLVVWLVLGRRWRDRDVKLGVVGASSAALLVGGLLLTFPPFMDFLQGK
ncbi:hypothetical protein [Phenylobacterium sp.]|uniref:hypothetical protein n=1 Tax=Phenylobacterium sp. TaxID=1871053 RepID=UPI00120A2B39|nr:hypothetical protein [Phenylobacterium sp.]THD58233.1 MAG: hypothetical protein E8A49_19820 [Phenylobacterium sp.]